MSINKVYQFQSSYNIIQKLGGTILPKEPPNTYLRRRHVAWRHSRLSSTSPDNSSTNSSSMSSNQLKDVPLKTKEVGSIKGFRNTAWLNNPTQKMAKMSSEFFGLASFKNAKLSINEAYMSYLEARERREAKQLLVNELNLKLRKPKPTKTILNESVILAEALANATKEEADALSRLSLAINETKPVEELFEKRVKHLSYLMLALCTSLGLVTLGTFAMKLLTNKTQEKEESNDESQTKEIKDEKLYEMNNKILQLEGLIADLTDQLNENQKWGMNGSGNVTEGECDYNHFCCFETRNNNSKIKNKYEQKMKSLQIHPRLLVDCDNSRLNDVSNNVFYDTCLLAGKATGGYCSLYIVRPNTKEIESFLEENEKNFTKTNFTGMALKFLLKNDSSSGLSAIVPVVIENLNKDEHFECGVFLKPKNVNIIGDRIGVDCGINTCKIHLDYLHYYIDGMHDLQSWKTKISYNGGVRVGGRNCNLLRIYAWTMVIPIIINLLFSGVIFYYDWRSGLSSKYETPFLLLLLYPQWRTLKILMRYFTHKEEEELVNQLDENDKDVSFIEPFCESGLQVRTFYFLLNLSLLILLILSTLNEFNESYLIYFRF